MKQVIKTIEHNVDSIAAALQDSKVQLTKPEGTYQVWLDFRKVYDHTKNMFNHLTEGSGIGMNAGHWFGREGALFMRMNIATENEKIIESMRRIKDALPDPV